jgi:hypothetical protein
LAEPEVRRLTGGARATFDRPKTEAWLATRGSIVTGRTGRSSGPRTACFLVEAVLNEVDLDKESGNY